MEWREKFAVRFGPGLFAGATFGTWLRILCENHFAVSGRYLFRAAITSGVTLGNVPICWKEDYSLKDKLNYVRLEPPVFILGHWRSGTSHLHNLLSVDSRFSFSGTQDVLFPQTFYTMKKGLVNKILRLFLPRRRPMDNMRFSLETPFEDEIATCIATARSPIMSFVFPRRRNFYDKYHTFADVPVEHLEEWKSALVFFLRKLTYRSNRPLILKSPQQTCRIRLLLELFPGAKFVHIHRNPEDIFRSAQHQVDVALRWYQLQSITPAERDHWIISRFRAMYESYFSERELIPEGHHHEVAYSDLVTEPMKTIRLLYEHLGLPKFAAIEATLQEYLASIAGYRANTFPELSNANRQRLLSEWRQYYSAWK